MCDKLPEKSAFEQECDSIIKHLLMEEIHHELVLDDVSTRSAVFRIVLLLNHLWRKHHVNV